MGARGLIAWTCALLVIGTSVAHVFLPLDGILEPLGGRLDRALQQDPDLPALERVGLPPLDLTGGGEGTLRFDAGNEAHNITLEWVYRQTRYAWPLTVDDALYREFHERERIQDPHVYSAYVTAPEDDEIIQTLARHLDHVARDRGFDPLERANFILAFVQGLPYVPDQVATPADDHPKYPVETLVEQGGDCEDTSILYVSLLQALGEDAVLLLLPGHMAAGIRLPGEDAHRYVETSATGLRVGEIPPALRGKDVTPIEAEPHPILTYRWWASPDGDHALRFVIQIENQGDAPSGPVHVTAAATPPGGAPFTSATTTHPLAPGETRWVEVPLPVPEPSRANDLRVTLADPESDRHLAGPADFRLASPPHPF